MKKVLSIEGMTCNNCKKHVTEALREVAGVKSATVDLAKKNAVVEGDTPVSDDALKSAVSEAGYTVTGISGN
ncbi:MAG: cation transporter [Nitrospinae bacterium]|nr:cation transporter [Nitrospinota bacterium]